MRGRTRLLLALPIGIVVGLVTACAGQTPAKTAPPPQTLAPLSPEEALRARATQFWEARVKGDLATQYDLLEPRSHEWVTLTAFARARSSVVFQSYKLQELDVAGDEGLVTASATFRMNLKEIQRFGPWTQRVIMRWVRVGGQWYVRYDQEGVKQPLQSGERRP
ncbi:MAG: hypothetical protein ACREJ6_14700 [Candidatus Methylomirabilis sp.]